MPFTSPPVFVDTQVLSASQLNILSDDVEYLHGLSQAANIPFPTIRDDHVDERYQIRHRLQYLHWRFVSDGGGGSTYWTWEIYYDGDIVASGTTTSAIGEVATGSVDLDASPAAPLTIGTWYEIRVLTAEPNGTTTGNYFEVSHLYEKATA